MRTGTWILLGAAATAGAALPLAARSADAKKPHAQTHELPRSADGDIVVGLCDGETSLEVDGVKPGQPMTAEQGREVSNKLMAEWLAKNPGKTWEGASPAAKPAVLAAAPVSTAKGDAKKQSGTYTTVDERDEKLWAVSTQSFVDEGNRIFHDAKLLGGTIAVSCDMCHPDGANTHPETYPKFQVQLGRVALLRDMVNWCIENPVRGKPLDDDDPKMKAIEAYIYAQRRGIPLEYGKR